MTGLGVRAAGGIVSAGLVIGVAELVSVPIGVGSAPLSALGAAVVDYSPLWLREWAIGTFGTSDKLVLFAVMGVVAAGIAALAGIAERPLRPAGSVVFAGFGIVAAVVALSRPGAGWTWVLPSTLGVCAGIAALRWFARRFDEPSEAGSGSTHGAGTEAGRTDGGGIRGEASPGAGAARSADTSGAGVERRKMLTGIAAVAALAATAGVVGRVLGARVGDVAGERAAIRLPVPPTPAPPVDPRAELGIADLAPYLTPTEEFYRIDTALGSPRLSTDEWSLRIHGMVDREIRIGWAELTARQPIERLVTLACVSNPVGGTLIGNARWLGYPLAELIAEAGPHPDADMVLSRSIDGFTAGSPLRALTDGRDALLAIGMNGEPLPVEHGYPARLVVPGLYGYVSATKWVTELKITRFDRDKAYWTVRGWSAQGPIKTGTRIDAPRGLSVDPGPVVLAGVAWAQGRGIDAVEVQIDDGPWQPAQLAAEPTVDSWRQWRFDWTAETGTHTIRARSTDGTGTVQTADIADVVPDGATGYPTRTIHVR